MDEQILKLGKLEVWLQERIGTSKLKFSNAECDGSPFLHVRVESSNYELKYLPAFHLCGTYNSGNSNFELFILNFSGKVLNDFHSTLIEDLSDNVLVPNFVTLFVEEKLSLCHGLPSDVTLFSTRDVFVEEVKSKVVTRSRKCRYAVTGEQEVCEECQSLSKEKIVERSRHLSADVAPIKASTSGLKKRKIAADRRGDHSTTKTSRKPREPRSFSIIPIPVSDGPSHVKMESNMTVGEEFTDQDLIPIQIKHETDYYEPCHFMEGNFLTSNSSEDHQVTKIEDGEENLEIFEDNPSLSKEDENICILTITGNEKRKKASTQISVKKSKNNQICSFEDEEKKGKKKRLKVEKEDSDYSDDDIEDDDEDDDDDDEDEEEDEASLQEIRRQRNGKKIKKVCESCNQIFPWLYLYEKHRKENLVCKMFLRNKKKAERRALRHPDDEPPKPKVVFRERCIICMDVYTKERNYLNDQRQHEKLIPDLDAPVKCPVCKETIEKKRNLNLHFEKEHTTNSGKAKDKALCLLCLRSQTQKYLKLHYLSSHVEREERFLCNLCGKKTKTKVLLEAHIVNKHGLSPVDLMTPTSRPICDLCGKSYPSIEILRQHISVIHKKGRKHPCDECKKTFYTKKALITHKICIHLKIHPFKCKQCPYTSGEMTTVYKHYQMKHGFRGVRSDVYIIEEELQRVRDLFNYNYCGFSAKTK